jgi:putative thiamine transport system substrate-binding protein
MDQEKTPMLRRTFLAATAGLLSLALLAPAFADRAAAAGMSWEETLEKAKGQTVYWNAWGGDDRINAYIAWAGAQVEERFGVSVEHVKLSDTADAVGRVVAEKAAGKDEGGSIDLIWINGENFASMKRQGLLHSPWTQDLPNYDLVDLEGKPTTRVDFTVPVENLEAPWGMAQMVFINDGANVPQPPRSIPALLSWTKENPGRFSYPQPPDFLGSTFLKQALIELLDDPSVLQAPVNAESAAAATEPLWSFLEDLHPNLWRQGQAFPANGPAMKQLLGDGEVDIAFSFYPADASSWIQRGEVPESVRTFIMEGGTIGNTHFVAIPYNASAPEGAQVLANFLMSPEAQARKQDPAHWGDFTVLDVAGLSAAEKARFEAIDLGVATLPPEELTPVLLEPHPSWMEWVESEWQRRYLGS